jgi:hypothetical protein
LPLVVEYYSHLRQPHSEQYLEREYLDQKGIK